MAPPLLAVISGPSGAGTTTLSSSLGAAIPCPVLRRDEIKEGLVHGVEDYMPEFGDAMAGRTFETFFGAIGFLVDTGVALVAEASFQHGLWERGLAPLLDRADVRIVHCRVDAAVARERIATRFEDEPARAAIHGDFSLEVPFESWKAQLESFEHVTLPVPTLEVDTSDGYEPSVDQIVAFLNR